MAVMDVCMIHDIVVSFLGLLTTRKRNSTRVSVWTRTDFWLDFLDQRDKNDFSLLCASLENKENAKAVAVLLTRLKRRHRSRLMVEL